MLTTQLSTIRFGYAPSVPFVIAYTIALVAMPLLIFAGVHLVVKVAEEFGYIEAAMNAPHWAIRLAVRAADRMGWEPMSEQECPIEMLPGDRARVWLAMHSVT